MDRDDRWLLPDGLEEVLPPDGGRHEALRRALLDLLSRWGYELVIPPLVEYLDSLLTGAGGDLHLQTFKLTDLESGRTLGVRADMTPQAARIDAHQLKRRGVTRLCYIGSVLRTRPEGLGRSRSPVQVGAELYGHAGIESDAEVVALMVEALHEAGIGPVHVDLGHVGVFGALAEEAGLDAADRDLLLAALQRKAVVEIEAMVNAFEGPAAALGECFLDLAELNGGPEVLDVARTRLAGRSAAVMAALDALTQLSEALSAQGCGATLHVDLAELRGFRYHSGVVFAAFSPGYAGELARGGRYDGVGAAFGRARPATGFSADLRTLLQLGERAYQPRGAVLAAWSDSASLGEEVRRLRGAGERVVWRLPGEDPDAIASGCDRELVRRAGGFEVRPLAMEGVGT